MKSVRILIPCFLYLSPLLLIAQTTGKTSGSVGVNLNLTPFDKGNGSLTNASSSEATSLDGYQLALPRLFPPSLPQPVSNLYYPINKSFLPRYDSIRTSYQKKIASMEAANLPQQDTLLLFYLHDLVLVRQVLYSPIKDMNILDDSTMNYLKKELVQARKINATRFELNAINKLESAEAERRNIAGALNYALARLALYENGLKSTCSSCNTVPKNYIAVGKLYRELNDRQDALRYYQKSLTQSTRSIDKEYASQQLAAYYRETGDPQKSLEVLDEIESDSTIRFYPFLTYKEKALALMALKKYDLALAYTTKSLEAEKEYNLKRGRKFSPQPYDSLFASIYLGLNQPYNALKYSNRSDVIDKVRTAAEQENMLRQAQLTAANQRLEIEKIKFDNENKRVAANAQQQMLLSRLEKNKIQAAAEQERFKQQADIALLAQNLSDQRRLRWILVISLGIFSVLMLILFYNARQKKRAYQLLDSQSHRLREQKEQLQKTVENLNSIQAKLVQSEKLASLGELTAGIAHEIQNPLNFVNNFAELNVELLLEMKTELERGNANEVGALMTDIIENDRKIKYHGQRADAIVKGMLQHSRTSSGKKEPVDLNALVDEYLRLSYHGLRAKDKSFNAEMHTDFDTSIGKINAIPQEMGRVFLNLFTNAFYSVAKKKMFLDKKHPGKKPGFEPFVFVKTKRKENTVIISVRDNGLGIASTVVNKIFQPFFTTKPPGEGTGLGLSVSYDIITKVHGGDLLVQTQEGEFAEFIIRLPVE